MSVKRIVCNIASDNLEATSRFYTEVLDMNIVMDLGWIQTLDADSTTQPQISVASEGGSGTVVPDISIEVDNLDDVYQRVLKLGITIEYKLTEEPWGVRRFYVRDPAGKLLNILSH